MTSKEQTMTSVTAFASFSEAVTNKQRRLEAKIHISPQTFSDNHLGWLECPHCGGCVSAAVPIGMWRPRNPNANIGRLSALHRAASTEHMDHDEDCFPLVCVECKEWLDCPLGFEVDF